MNFTKLIQFNLIFGIVFSCGVSWGQEQHISEDLKKNTLSKLKTLQDSKPFLNNLKLYTWSEKCISICNNYAEYSCIGAVIGAWAILLTKKEPSSFFTKKIVCGTVAFIMGMYGLFSVASITAAVVLRKAKKNPALTDYLVEKNKILTLFHPKTIKDYPNKSDVSTLTQLTTDETALLKPYSPFIDNSILQPKVTKKNLKSFKSYQPIVELEKANKENSLQDNVKIAKREHGITSWEDLEFKEQWPDIKKIIKSVWEITCGAVASVTSIFSPSKN
jgi:hypothetical protein